MENSPDEPVEKDTELIMAAEKVLEATLGRPAHFKSMKRLTGLNRRSGVYRCTVGPGTGPALSYIIKQAEVFNLSAKTIEPIQMQRFTNDWVGAEFLSVVTPVDPIGPQFYGGDPEAGFFIIEDLGEHRSLVQPLLEGNAASSDEALLKYSACLGRLHAVTAGKAAGFADLFQRRLPGGTPYAYDTREIGHNIEMARAHLDQFGVPVDAGTEAEFQSIAGAITDPGPFLAYIHSDPGPDNVFDVGDRLRLIDFETSHFGHALLDGVFPRMFFPTCWCVSRLPDEMVARMEARYRAELVKGIPEAQEDAVWETALVHLCGHVLISTLADFLGNILEKDRDWGIATARQRVLARLAAFIRTSEEFHRLPVLRGAASRMLPILQTAWPETQPLPLYPAFLPMA